MDGAGGRRAGTREGGCRADARAKSGWQMEARVTTDILDKSFTKDDLVIEIQMVFDPGAVVQTLADPGTVVECLMTNESLIVPATSATVNVVAAGTDERIVAVWPNDTLAKGQWRGQARVTVEGHTQTVYEWVIAIVQSI
jgi:hypothetical protein